VSVVTLGAYFGFSDSSVMVEKSDWVARNGGEDHADMMRRASNTELIQEDPGVMRR
jgi:hypothetical protein